MRTLITPEPIRKKAVREKRGRYLKIRKSFAKKGFPSNMFSGPVIR